MKTSERAQALSILLKLLEQHQPLAHHLQDPTLSPFTKTLCFGVARYYYRLTAIADTLVDKHPKDLKIWVCILMGLFQISVLHLPDYAVVQETVALLPRQQAWAKGFVNAILRRFCREQASLHLQLEKRSDYRTMHPAWLIKKLKTDWPDNWENMIHANNQHPPMSMRVNLSRISLEQYCTKLDQSQIAYRLIPHTSAGLIITHACPVQDLPGFMEGAISVQDGAAQLAGPLLDLQPGLRVLDACCAPGGKLSQILELEPDLAACIGVDLDTQRLERVLANCKRLGIQPSLHQGDATQPQSWWDGQLFDRILLDTPCSATGILRRHPDIRILRDWEEIQAVSHLQSQILSALWPLLAPGGILIYATCSIIPEENAQQIQHFIQEHADAEIDMTVQSWGHQTEFGWQILPGEHDMDGFFYAKIFKKKQGE